MPRPMEDYVEVAERIEKFYERYPEGSLRCKETHIERVGEQTFLVYVAQAWRTPTDAAPAEGSAWEPVPGKTNFTKDSELMNAETSAWGRAIAALGFEVRRGIASRQEVMNRRDVDVGGVSPASGETQDTRGAADVSADAAPSAGEPASPQLKGAATRLLNGAGLAREARQAVLLWRCGTLKDPPAGPLRALVKDLEDGATAEALIAEVSDARAAGDDLGIRAAAMLPTDVPDAEPPPEPEAPDGDDIPF